MKLSAYQNELLLTDFNAKTALNEKVKVTKIILELEKIKIILICDIKTLAPKEFKLGHVFSSSQELLFATQLCVDTWSTHVHSNMFLFSEFIQDMSDDFLVIEEMYVEFKDSFLKRLEDLKTAELYKKTLHDLKSTSLYFGATDLSEKASLFLMAKYRSSETEVESVLKESYKKWLIVVESFFKFQKLMIGLNP